MSGLGGAGLSEKKSDRLWMSWLACSKEEPNLRQTCERSIPLHNVSVYVSAVASWRVYVWLAVCTLRRRLEMMSSTLCMRTCEATFVASSAPVRVCVCKRERVTMPQSHNLTNLLYPCHPCQC